MELIDKSAIVAEIKKKLDKHSKLQSFNYGAVKDLESLLNFLDTLEVKEVDTWHLQEKEDIYDAVKDWSLYTFACLMKDGTIQKFTGYLDEDCEGHVNAHVDGVNYNYDDVDDIIKWTELPM